MGLSAAARITGDIQQFDIAEMAAETVLSSPFVLPYFELLARVGKATVAVQRDDAAAAQEQYGTLESLHVMLAYSSTDRLLGLLSVTMGQLDQAMGHFDDALAFCRNGGYGPELAWTCCDYADALLQRASTQPGRSDSSRPVGTPKSQDDRAKAMSLLDESLSISRELGMRPLMERVLSRREILNA